MTALVLRELTKTYGTVTALDAVSLSVRPADVVGVIGTNGAGKTTTMRLILGLIKPTSGTSSVLGTDPWRARPELRRRIGYLPGELKLDGRVTGSEFLQHFGRISGPVDATFRAELVERLGLDPSRRIGTLSKGNKQKIGLVQAFMHKPELLVLDEPTSGLDPLVQREFLALVREAKAAGQAVFLSSHVISEVQQCADQVAVLREGRLVRSARLADLREAALRTVRLVLREALTSDQQDELARAGFAPGPASSAAPAAPGAGPGFVVEGRLSGSPVPLLAVLPGLALADVVIEEPDLEQTVLELYGDPGRTGADHGD